MQHWGSASQHRSVLSLSSQKISVWSLLHSLHDRLYDIHKHPLTNTFHLFRNDDLLLLLKTLLCWLGFVLRLIMELEGDIFLHLQLCITDLQHLKWNRFVFVGVIKGLTSFINVSFLMSQKHVILKGACKHLDPVHRRFIIHKGTEYKLLKLLFFYLM